jgi:hypothetical protein
MLMIALKAAMLVCMLGTIFFLLMVIGFIPSERICKWLRKNEWAQVCLLIIVSVGLISSACAVF